MKSVRDVPLAVFALSMVAMWFSTQIGISFRRRALPLQEGEQHDFNLVIPATLTLLGLIIGFSFRWPAAATINGKITRKQRLMRIGTEYVRADLLPDSHAGRVRELLKRYLDQRVVFYETRDEHQLGQINAQTARLQSELWSVVQGRCEAANVSGWPRSFRHERHTKFARVHASCLVVPLAGCGLDLHGRYRNFWCLADRLQFSPARTWFSGFTASSINLILSYS